MVKRVQLGMTWMSQTPTCHWSLVIQQTYRHTIRLFSIYLCITYLPQVQKSIYKFSVPFPLSFFYFYDQISSFIPKIQLNPPASIHFLCDSRAFRCLLLALIIKYQKSIFIKIFLDSNNKFWIFILKLIPKILVKTKA